MLIAQTAELGLNQWFVRAHIENTSGELMSRGTNSEIEGAVAAAVGDPLE